MQTHTTTTPNPGPDTHPRIDPRIDPGMDPGIDPHTDARAALAREDQAAGTYDDPDALDLAAERLLQRLAAEPLAA